MSRWTWNTQPSSHAQRKFIELIYNRTGKYANWDPPVEIQVGSYGRIDKSTGNLIVEGSIYDNEFRPALIDVNIDIESGEHHPKDCPEEIDFTAWSKNVKRLELSIDSHADIPGIASAAIKGTFEVKKGTTGAILLMHKPRMRCIASGILGKLEKISLFQDMHLVTKVFYCPAFSLYLSDKSGEKISIALLGSAHVLEAVGATTGGGAALEWWSDTQAGLSRRGCKIEHCFTPLYDLQHARRTRHRRTSPSPERTGEDLWISPRPPWPSLDEEGNYIPVYVPQSESSSDEGSE